MNNSSLFFRSLAIIALLAGVAHWATSASRKNDSKELVKQNDTSGKSEQYNANTDYIIGKWRVEHDNEDFKGGIVYEIKKEHGEFNAYTIAFLDERGNTTISENDKMLTIESFDGYRGDGVYVIEYEGGEYDVSCQIDMVNENSFQLSYYYHGYSDTETWKRQ